MKRVGKTSKVYESLKLKAKQKLKKLVKFPSKGLAKSMEVEWINQKNNLLPPLKKKKIKKK